MDAMGEIEIKLEGSVGKETLRPEHVGIKEIREVLNQAAHLLFLTEKRAQRPLTSYEIDEGSVRHELFDYDTSYSDNYLDELMKI